MADYNPTDNFAKSLFNEAGFVIRRLDILQSRINTVRINPLAWNQEMNCYNYQVRFADCCSLLNECWAKLTDDEQKEVKVLRDLIQMAIKIIPPHKLIRKAGDNSVETKVSIDNWDKIERAMDIFEEHIKTYLNNHGLANPDVEGDMF